MKKIILLIIIASLFLLGCENPIGGSTNSDTNQKDDSSLLDLDNIAFSGNYVPSRILRDPIVRDNLILTTSGLYQINGGGSLIQITETPSAYSMGRMISGDLVVTGYSTGYPAVYSFVIDQGSSLDSLTLKSETILPSRPWDLEIYDDHLYVTVNDGALLIYDISDPSTPVLVRTVVVNRNVSYTNSEMEIYGHDLLITGELNLGDGVMLHSYDLSDPTLPVLNSSINVTGIGAGIWDLIIVGRNLVVPASDYVAGDVGKGWLKLYSLEDPANPSLIQNTEIPSVLYEPLALLSSEVQNVDKPIVALSYTQGYRIDLFEYNEHSSDPSLDELVLKEQLNPIYMKSQLCSTPFGLLASTQDGIFSFSLNETEYADGFRQPSHFFFAGNSSNITHSGDGLILNGHIFQPGHSSLDDSTWSRFDPTIRITSAEAGYANGYLYIAANFYSHVAGSAAPTRETGLAVYQTDSQGKPLLPRTDFISTPLKFLSVNDGWGYLSGRYLDLSDPAHPSLSTVFNTSIDEGSSCSGDYAAYVDRAMNNNRVILYEKTSDTVFTARFSISLDGPIGAPVIYTTDNGDSRLIVSRDDYNTNQVSLQVYKLDWTSYTSNLLGEYTTDLIPSVTTANEYPQLIYSDNRIVFGHRKGFEVLSITDNADGSVSLEQVKGFSLPGLSFALNDQSLFIAGRIAGFHQFK